jgi:hypothetical protein
MTYDPFLDPPRRPRGCSERTAYALSWSAGVLVLVNVGGRWPRATVTAIVALVVLALVALVVHFLVEGRRHVVEQSAAAEWERARIALDHVTPGQAIGSCAVVHPATRDAVSRGSIHGAHPQPVEVLAGLRIYTSPHVKRGEIVVLRQDAAQRLGLDIDRQ